MRKFVALGAMLAAAGSGCGEQPRTKVAPTPMEKILEENQKAAEALVHAARHVAEKASDQAQDAVDAVGAVAKGGSSGAKEAIKSD